MFFKVQIDS